MRLRRRSEYLAAQGAGFRYRCDFGLIAISTRKLDKKFGDAIVEADEPSTDRMSRVARRVPAAISRTSYTGPRLGITVTKRVGNAPIRNRWKRLIRESFRTGPAHWEHANGLDFVVIIRPGSSFTDVHSVQRGFRDAYRRWKRVQSR